MTRLTWLLVATAALMTACGGDDDDNGNGEDSGILTEDLAMPAEPTVSVDNFESAEECGGCHQQHFAEWKTSMHSYSMVDPVYRAIVKVRQDDFDGAQDRFCLQCHSAIGVRSGDIQPGFAFENLQPITLEGITCTSCHKVASIARTFNSGHVIDDTGPIRGPFNDPVAGAHEALARSGGNSEIEGSPIFDTSDFCGACHDILEVDGLNLERPFAEWLESKSAEDGQNCQSCHMPSYEGTAAAGGRERTLHRHTWVGVDVPLSEGFLTEEEENQVRERAEGLLTDSATVELTTGPAVAGQPIDLFVTLENKIPGHNFPTGSTFNRQVWVEVVARDAEDNVVYQTGNLDANGDLRNYFSELDQYGDPDLLFLSSGFVDEEGTPQIFSWRAKEHTSYALSPLYVRTHTLFIPTDESTVGPITVSARIRFRAFPPYLLRALELDQYLPRLDIFDVNSTEITVPIDVVD